VNAQDASEHIRACCSLHILFLPLPYLVDAQDMSEHVNACSHPVCSLAPFPFDLMQTQVSTAGLALTLRDLVL